MKYHVKRLLTEERNLAGYQLFSESGSLLLVADLIANLSKSTERQVRFVRPDGTLLATMSLPVDEPATPPSLYDYVIIQDYAVYAIVTNHRRAQSDQGAAEFYTMEAEGTNWLIMHAVDQGESFHLFGQFSLAARAFDKLTEDLLPPLIGEITPLVGEGHSFEVELSSRRWRQTSLVVLALVFLLDTTSSKAARPDTVVPAETASTPPQANESSPNAAALDPAPPNADGLDIGSTDDSSTDADSPTRVP